jgi:hypothetical protein
MSIKNDILKENGIYSIKRVMALYILIIASFLGLFIVISDKVLDKVVNPYAIQVFNTLMAAVLTLIVASVVDKKFTTKTEV